MKNIFYIHTDSYSKTPVMAFDNYNDALHCAASYKDCKDEDARQYVRKLPMCETKPQHIDTNDLDSVIEMTIKACVASAAAIASKQEEA